MSAECQEIPRLCPLGAVVSRSGKSLLSRDSGSEGDGQ